MARVIFTWMLHAEENSSEGTAEGGLGNSGGPSRATESGGSVSESSARESRWDTKAFLTLLAV